MCIIFNYFVHTCKLWVLEHRRYSWKQPSVVHHEVLVPIQPLVEIRAHNTAWGIRLSYSPWKRSDGSKTHVTVSTGLVASPLKQVIPLPHRHMTEHICSVDFGFWSAESWSFKPRCVCLSIVVVTWSAVMQILCPKRTSMLTSVHTTSKNWIHLCTLCLKRTPMFSSVHITLINWI